MSFVLRTATTRWWADAASTRDTAPHPYVVQATSPLSTDSDVVNLVFGFAVRRNPCFMNGLVWEQSASNDQIIKEAKFGEEFSIFNLLSGTVGSHGVITVCVVYAYFCIQVSRQNFPVSLWDFVDG